MHHHITVMLTNAAGIAAAVLAAALLALACWRFRRLAPRLAKSALAGAVAAALVTGYAAAVRHATLARAAKTGHTSLRFVLASGFGAVFVVVTVAAFAVATLWARRRRGLRPVPSYQRGRVGAGWEDW
jgi:hypothetical protein